MKICLVNTRQGFGGGERWFLWAAGALKDRGHEIVLVAPSSSTLLSRAVDLLATNPSDSESNELLLPPHFRPEIVNPFKPDFGQIFSNRRPDTVICNTGREARLAIAARGKAKQPKIVIRRGLCRDLGGGFFKARSYRHLDGVLTNSKKTAGVLRTAHPWLEGKDIEVIYNPAPPPESWLEPDGAEEPAVSSKGDEIIVLSLGRLDGDKGHIYLVEAFEDVIRDCPDARLIIAGMGSEYSSLRKRIDGLGLDGIVDLFGYSEYPHMLYRMADIFVMPSLPGYESFSNAALEAMSFALPLVATTVGGFPEMIIHGEHGLLVPPADPKPLAGAIKRLVEEVDLRNRLGASARRRAKEDFAPDRIAGELESYLERVAETS